LGERLYVNTQSQYCAQRVVYVCESRRAASPVRAQAQMTELDRGGGYIAVAQLTEVVVCSHLLGRSRKLVRHVLMGLCFSVSAYPFYLCLSAVVVGHDRASRCACRACQHPPMLHARQGNMPAQTTPPLAQMDMFWILVAAFCVKYMEWA